MNMDPTRFDELTKALASSTSRRQALRRIGGILGGTALAGLFPGLALAGGGNSACAQFCASVFGADTPAAGQCTSDAAHQRGLCYTCGPASSAGTQPICCPENPNGTCTSYSSATCCGQFEFCFQGVCEGCFTAGTLVAMADGTSRPIEHVQVGDLVLGNAGRVNRVTAVLLPVLGQRSLYALNGGNFFVTAGHPFMTEEGWKAIDPAATPAEHAGLHVGRLAVGDHLLNLAAVAVQVGGGRASSAESVDVRIERVALRNLVGRSADPATQLYNLRLDGNHTYFANDLLVHNK
jgi:hypothetical protein